MGDDVKRGEIEGDIKRKKRALYERDEANNNV